MNVDLAQERILLIADRFNLETAEKAAWAKRMDAFGALAMIGGLISKPKDEDYEIIYREKRLQPFWRITAHTDCIYERNKDHRIKVGPEITHVTLFGNRILPAGKEIVLPMTETCREETRRELLFDGLTKAPAPVMKSYLGFDNRVVSSDEINDMARHDIIVVPPQAKSSSLTRQVLSQVMPKVEADRIVEEKVELDAIDLYYRPIHAFRFLCKGKEAVVEFDAATGEARVGGATFETYMGKFIDPQFLLDVGVEAATMFIPGVNLAKIVVKQMRKA
jgi:hypothetical protein